jgi:hypothetical protein
MELLATSKTRNRKPMTPKEKAKQLVDKFTVVGLQQRNEGIQCALICVDEVLDEYWSHDCNRRDWWKQVKEEIRKL